MNRIISQAVLRRIIEGDTTAPLDGDALNLARYGGDPDLRFAEPKDLEPLFTHPGLRAVRHLEMAEGAADTLEYVLSQLAPGTLESLSIHTTEAYTTAISSDTLGIIANHAATQALKVLRAEYSWISGVAGFVGGALRGLETLSLLGGIDADSLRALSGSAPVLRTVKHLTLSPSELTASLTQRMVTSPDLAQVQTLTLPFVQGSGFDWTPSYDDDGRIVQIPAAIHTLQALPALKRLRLTAPYEDCLEVSPQLVFGLLDQLSGGMLIEIAGELLGRWEEVIRTWRGDALDNLFYDLGVRCEQPPAWWLEGLFRRGLAAAMCVDASSPVEAESAQLDAIAATLRRQGVTTDADTPPHELQERWGDENLAAILSERMGETVCLDYGTLWTPPRVTEQDVLHLDDILSINEQLWPDGALDQATFGVMVESLGVERIAALYQSIFSEPLIIERVDGEWRVSVSPAGS